MGRGGQGGRTYWLEDLPQDLPAEEGDPIPNPVGRNGAGTLLAKGGDSSPAVVWDGARGLPGVGSGTHTCPCKDGSDSGALLVEKGDTVLVMALGERALAPGGGVRKHHAHPRGDR